MTDYMDAIAEYRLNVGKLEAAAQAALEYLQVAATEGEDADAALHVKAIKSALIGLSPTHAGQEQGMKAPTEPAHLAPFVMEKTNDKGARVMSGACMARWRQGAWRCDRCSQLWPQGTSGPPCKTSP